MWIYLKNYYSKILFKYLLLSNKKEGNLNIDNNVDTSQKNIILPLLGEYGKKEANHCRFGRWQF